jgi:hypothetical protein
MGNFNRRALLSSAVIGATLGRSGFASARDEGKRPNLKGTWDYQSFLVLPSDAEVATPPGSSVTARKWAKGSLSVPDDTGEKIKGELSFAPGVKLVIDGRISPANDDSPTTLEATGEATDGPIKGTRYQITGWIVPSTTDAKGRPQIRGSVRAARGPLLPKANPTDPDKYAGVEPGKMPVGTVGTFILTPA